MCLGDPAQGERVLRLASRFVWVVLALGAVSVCACDDPAEEPGSDATMGSDTASTGDVETDQTDTTPGPVCGNDQLEGRERCDGSAHDGETCESLGFGPGTLVCRADCSGFDTSGCTPPIACGNDTREADETCDGIDLDGASCSTLGYDGGVLLCNARCDGYLTTGCYGASACGDGELNPGELCDSDALDGQTCQTQGFLSGLLRCAPDCQAFDTSACLSACGNDALDEGEECDGEALGGTTCESLGYASGTLACTASCTFDETGCTMVTCGDGVLEPGEPCEDDDLGGATCESEGFDGGVLVCNQCVLDTSGCSLCGNDAIEGDEVCDGTDLAEATCQDLGYTGGTLGCQSDCSAYDRSGCQGLTPQTPSLAGDLVITELMKNPAPPIDDSMGEYFELYNPSDSVTYNLKGCIIGSLNDTGHIISEDVLIEPREYLALAASSSPGFVPGYVYNRNNVQFGNGTSDSVNLNCVTSAGLTLIDEVAYGSGWPDPNGASLSLSPDAISHTANDVGANWCAAPTTTLLLSPENLGTPGALNDACP